LILAFGLVAVGLPLALVVQLGVVRALNDINVDIVGLREGQIGAASVLQLASDEESGIRGYAATRRTEFLEPYSRARRRMGDQLRDLGDHLADPGGRERNAYDDLGITNARWLQWVGDPVAAGEPLSAKSALEGKTLMDRFRDDVRVIEASQVVAYDRAAKHRAWLIHTASTISVAVTATIGVEIVVFAFVLARMRIELDREHAVAESLQRIASARLVPPSHLRIGTAYRSATRGVRIGGDLYDVYRLDDDRTLLVIGDVSGKGLSAAFDTTFVRYAVRTLAGEGLAPDEILTRFDLLYHAANPAPESFVTLFVGIHDRRSRSLAYSNAGHEAAWIRSVDRLTMLAPTGPIIGLGGFPFAAAETALTAGDVLILATDGLTEARDRSGRFVTLHELNRWLMNADASDPATFADDILRTAAQWTRGNIGDDLALLIVAPSPPAGGV
jgi:serine phosphatase RsbU (regulator of sigma subunit)